MNRMEGNGVASVSCNEVCLLCCLTSQYKMQRDDPAVVLFSAPSHASWSKERLNTLFLFRGAPRSLWA